MEILIVMVLVLVVLYVVTIRPQRQRQQQQQSMVDAAGVGDDVLTQGGIYGTITRAEADDIVVDLGKGLEVHMTRRGIAAVLPPEEDEADVIDADGDPAEDLAAEVEPDDEASVSREEESVTSRADADTAAAERR
ncbi:MAG: preprotein translocase subunit YajC [Gaiellaceae bacterium]